MLPGFQGRKVCRVLECGPRTRLGWVETGKRNGLGGSKHHETWTHEGQKQALQTGAVPSTENVGSIKWGREEEPCRAFKVWQDNGAGLYLPGCWGGGDCLGSEHPERGFSTLYNSTQISVSETQAQ